MYKNNKEKPFISVVLPTYNHAHFLKDAIDSVIKQDYSNWELIIIDNNSTDDTNQVISLFRDNRIKIHKINNYGIIAKSRNKGIQESNGDWIAFLDSDDIWYFNKLTTIISFLNKDNNIDIVCSNEYLHNKSTGKKKILRYGPDSENIYHELLINGNRLSTSSTLVKKSFLYEKELFFDESNIFVTVEDYDLWMRIALSGGKFGFCEAILGEYTIHDSNSSNNFDLHRNNLENVLRKHVFEIQRFNLNHTRLWSQIKPRLDIIDFKNNFKENFFPSLNNLIGQLLKNSKFHFLYLKNTIIIKIKSHVHF